MNLLNTKMSADMIINYLTGKPRMMLLIDAIGAFITSYMLGVVLVNNTDLFGMPTDVLQPLSAVAACFALYSFCGYLFAKKYKLYIRIIALANFCYCIASAAVIIKYYQELTTFGLIYFLGEIAVILSLVAIELRIANSAK